MILLTGVAGCQPEDACGMEEGAPCGGSPIGRWLVSTACQDPTYLAPVHGTHLGQTTPVARQAPPEPASADWCANLKYGPTGIASLNLPRDTPTLQGAYIRYGSDNSYGAFVTLSSRATFEFSWSCITRFGYASTCAEFGEAFAAYGARLGGIKDTACQETTNGCSCDYTSESDAAGTNLIGTWQVNGSVLTHFAESMELPSQVDFCRSDGDHLTLWGHERALILESQTTRSWGLRSLELESIPCGDGIIERDECEPPNTDTCNAYCETIQ